MRIFTRFPLYISLGFAATRPWVLNKISSAFIEAAISYRSSTVPETRASSIAETIISGAISPPQVTELVSSLENVVISDGINPPASAVLKLAQEAHEAYTEVKASSGFDNYLKYVSVNAKKFKLDGVYQGTTSSISTLIQQAISRLEETATGKEAVQSIFSLVDQVAHDAGVAAPNIPHT